MMTDKLRAAAKAALEWLRDRRLDTSRYMECGQFYEDRDKQAEALEAALAEPEQEPMLEMNPEKRPWVGLTDEEIDKWNIVGHESLREFVRSLEAKLKDKNA